jgi:hypothetical protein
MEERKEALNTKTLGKRSKVDLCVHGINKKYCTPCNTKKAPKSKKAKAEPAVIAAAKPTAE